MYPRSVLEHTGISWGSHETDSQPWRYNGGLWTHQMAGTRMVPGPFLLIHLWNPLGSNDLARLLLASKPVNSAHYSGCHSFLLNVPAHHSNALLPSLRLGDIMEEGSECNIGLREQAGVLWNAVQAQCGSGSLELRAATQDLQKHLAWLFHAGQRCLWCWTPPEDLQAMTHW